MINDTAYFVRWSGLQASSLFYGLANNDNLLGKSMPDWMVGPYRGDLRYSPTIKFDLSLQAKLSYLDGIDTSLASHTVKLQQQSYLGICLPKQRIFTLEKYFSTNTVQPESDPGTDTVLGLIATFRIS